jgi:hypothetical protein
MRLDSVRVQTRNLGRLLLLKVVVMSQLSHLKNSPANASRLSLGEPKKPTWARRSAGTRGNARERH